MVCENQVLLVDAGNTRVKYVTLDKLSSNVAVCDNLTALLNKVPLLGNIHHIFLANVASDENEVLLHQFCAANNIQLHIIRTEKQQFGLHNSYAQVDKMGVDRWLAMIAAHEMTEQAFAVIDIGTAITCDFVADGQHLGGWITPGFQLMKESLVKNTARVFADDRIPEDFSVGQTTQDCVSFGCQAAVRGVYLSAVDYLASKQTDFSIIIGGGGKNMLAFAQFNGSILVANLVVHGLARYARSLLLT